MSDDERPQSPLRRTEATNYASERRTPLPGLDKSLRYDTNSQVSSAWKHFALFLSLASEIADELMEEDDPAFTNFLRNLRDHDLGLFSAATDYIGRGLTFAVRRSTMTEHRPVVFKSTIPDKDFRGSDIEEHRLSAILLELRVLTHPPLRAHPNIVTLFQVGWEGDSFDEFQKWPVSVVEYAELGTLEDFFDRESSTPFATRKTICQDVTNGLMALHECQVVHGDIKLLNVLMFAEDEQRSFIAKLSDFGGALLDIPNMTSLQLGTPPWNAPERGSERPREDLLKSDVYSLGLLIWHVMLNGKSPFDDKELFQFPEPQIHQQKWRDAVEVEKLNDRGLLEKANRSIEKVGDVDCHLVSKIFHVSLRVSSEMRDINTVANLLDCSERLSFITLNDDPMSENNSETSVVEQTNWITQQEPVFPLKGLVFQAVTAPLRPRIRHVIDQVLTQSSPEARMDAAISLAITSLSGDDFGGDPDVELGLKYLREAAEMGYREHQALILRLHKTFGQEVPPEITPKIGNWLLDAAATGSMTAAEDLKQYGYTAEHKVAMHLLRTRYCGIGEETFDYDEVAAQALLSPSKNICRDYISAEYHQMKKKDRDWSGYLLRLAATYGSPHGIAILVEDHAVPVDINNDVGETPLYCAARSGHYNTILQLLQFRADPRKVTDRGDNALHWLCSFEEEEVAKVLSALLQAGADINAQAKAVVEEDERMEYSETEYVAGTPLHRAISRNKELAVHSLLQSGADLLSPSLEDPDLTPIVLATRLHYPRILKLFEVGANELLLTPNRDSILIHAMSGGSLFGGTIGRLIRHGPEFAARATETLAYLLERGASNHLPDLPGRPRCTAIFYAAQTQVAVLDFLLRNGGKREIDIPAKRSHDPDDQMTRPPLFEAVLYGKTQNVVCLLDHGANVRAVQNPEIPTTILYQCAESSYQELSIIDRLLDGGIGVDEGPEGYETPLFCAVRNRCFILAEHLLAKGANPNALATKGLMFRSLEPLTLLGALVNENSQSCLACVQFLLRERPGCEKVNLMVQPSRHYTVFHLLASLDGDQQDPEATRSLLEICGVYFQPTSRELNARSKAWDIGVVESAGGNTALHLAIIHANYEVIYWLLVMNDGVDVSTQNDFGFTAQDLATLQYTAFEDQFILRDIPQHPSKQLRKARERRDGIMRLLDKYVTDDSSDVFSEYTLDV